MMNKKPLLLSIAAALSLAGVSVAGTFALFTDKADTKIDVGAGIVDIDNTLSIDSVYSLNPEDLGEGKTEKISDTDARYINYGTSTVEHVTVDNTLGTVNIPKWTPGDGIILKTSPNNKSNVNAKMRLRVVMNGELSKALTIKVTNLTTNAVLRMTGEKTLVSAWSDILPTVNPDAYTVEITFPDHDDGEIRYASENKDNQYMDKSATIRIMYEAVQGNASIDSLLEEANSYLADQEVGEGMNVTCFDAITDLKEYDATLSEDTLKSRGWLWNQQVDQFVLEATVAPADAYHYFKVYDAAPSALSYSVYSSKTWSAGNVLVDGVGFDAGENNNIDSITYQNTTGEVRDIVLRSNSLATSLSVSAYVNTLNESDTIKHYGFASNVAISNAGGNSYHEFGNIPFIEISKGRVVLEKGSEVDNLHINKKSATEDSFEKITIAYDAESTLPTFSRDAVSSIPEEGTLVVELQNNTVKEEADSSYVWLYQQGLAQQNRVSESATEAGDVVSTDAAVDSKTQKAAEEISNLLRGGATYTEEQITQGEVLVADIVEAGLTEETKEEAKQEAINEKAEEVLTGVSAARINGKGYETVQAAVDAAVDGQVVTLLDSTNESVTIHGKDITLDLNKYTIQPNSGYAVCVYDADDVTIKNGTLNGYVRVGEHKRTNARVVQENYKINGEYAHRFESGYHPLAPVTDLVLEDIELVSNMDYAIYYTNIHDEHNLLESRYGADDYMYGHYIYKTGYTSYDQYYEANRLDLIATPCEDIDHVTVKGGSYVANQFVEDYVDNVMSIVRGNFSNASVGRVASGNVLGQTANKFVIPAEVPAEYTAKVNDVYFAYAGGANDAINYAKVGETVYINENADATKLLGHSETLTIVAMSENIEWTGAQANSGYEVVAETTDNVTVYSTKVEVAARLYAAGNTSNANNCKPSTLKNEYGTLKEAYDNAGSGDIVQVAKNLLIDTYENHSGYGNCYIFNGGRIGLDLNGYTVTYTGKGALIWTTASSGSSSSAGFIFMDSSAAKTGTIRATAGNCINKNNGKTSYFEIKSGNYISETGYAVNFNSSNVVVISGGYFQGKSISVYINGWTLTSVTISGGIFANQIGGFSYASKTTITGGKFKTIPSGVNLASGKAWSAEPDEDGYYTLVAA